RYVGLMASRQRARDDMEALRRKGVPQSFVDSVYTPIGFDIGAVTPEEIALSIMTELVSQKRGKQPPHKLLGEALKPSAP
ncbi:MAG: XdhC family protein, partial [Thaumarchaeota archaeon]|nr:XdhC family protein [Nitrososphaerota archaeon]